MNDFAAHLAAEARRLGLDLSGLTDAHPDAVQDFARRVLEELVALGLMQGVEKISCWARPRPTEH